MSHQLSSATYLPAAWTAFALIACFLDLAELRGAGSPPQGGGASAPAGNLRARAAQTAAQSGNAGRGYGRVVGYANTLPYSGVTPPQASMVSPMFAVGNPIGQTSPYSYNAAPASAAAIQVTNPAPMLVGRSGPVTLGFDAHHAPSSEVASAIAKRLGSLPSLHFLTPVQVEVVGRTAILRGKVASAHDRDLAGRVLLLEASIDGVDNRLQVGDSKLPQPPAPGERSSPLPNPPQPKG